MNVKQLGEMNFSQVVFMAEMLLEKGQQEERRMCRAAAMIIWHLGGAPKKTYDNFLESIGLSENGRYTRDDKKAAIEKSNAVIAKLDKIRNKNQNAGTI